jgi:hypothetical protein
MGAGKQVLYAKLRPQKADIANLCRDLRKVFVGYPAWRQPLPADATPDREHLIDVSQRNDRIDASELSVGTQDAKKYAKSVNRQRTMIREVGIGSIVLVPRLGDGILHVARVASDFRVFDPRDWTSRYLDERRRAELPAEDPASHIGDVMQGWETEAWTTVPFPAVPRWISQSALARNTIGIVRGTGGGRSPWEEMNAILSRQGALSRPMVRKSEELIRRMTDFLSPGSFEHLCVDLMQLEHPTEIWTHVGGSGDGGADGLGYGPEGTVSAILQCKYQWPGEVYDPRANPIVGRGGSRLIVASLVHGEVAPSTLPESTTWLGSQEVAGLVMKHRKRLPIAIALGLEGAQ